MPRLGELYPGICLTTEEKARKNLSSSVTFPLFAGIKGPEYEKHTYVCKTYRPTLNDMLCISHTKSATENKEVTLGNKAVTRTDIRTA